MQNDPYALTRELIDVFLTLSIAFRLHKGKKQKMKSITKSVMDRCYFPESKGYCNLILKTPNEAEKLLNFYTRHLYGREILTITEN